MGDGDQTTQGEAEWSRHMPHKETPTHAPSPSTFLSERAAAADLTIVTFQYRNHRGEVSQRRVYPVGLWFGCTAWHTGHGQWFLKAFDLDRQGQRDFAMSGMLGPWLPLRKVD